jgi:hypothetical protein
MHDIHPANALALPTLLKELKAGGYLIVHVVAAGDHPKSLPEVVASPIEKENWPSVLHAKTEDADAAKSELRERVKTAVGKRHHRRVVKHKDNGKSKYTTSSLVKQRSSN